MTAEEELWFEHTLIVSTAHSCKVCGALVRVNDLTTHIEWHNALNEQIRKAMFGIVIG